MQVKSMFPGLKEVVQDHWQRFLAYKQLKARKRGIPGSSSDYHFCQLQEAFHRRHNYFHVPKTAMEQKQNKKVAQIHTNS